MAKNLALVDRVREVATEKDATPAQVALAWVLSRGADVVPIPGTKRPARLEENLGALDVTLDRADLDRLADLQPAGARHPDMTWVSRDTRAT